MSGKAVAYVTRKGNLIGGLVWTDAGSNADLPDGTKLYLHPTTVTDEDVERAALAYDGSMPTGGHDIHHHLAMRAALSSFANKENRNE